MVFSGALSISLLDLSIQMDSDVEWMKGPRNSSAKLFNHVESVHLLCHLPSQCLGHMDRWWSQGMDVIEQYQIWYVAINKFVQMILFVTIIYPSGLHLILALLVMALYWQFKYLGTSWVTVLRKYFVENIVSKMCRRLVLFCSQWTFYHK